MIGGWWGRPLLPKILDQTDRVGAKSPIFDLFSLKVTQRWVSAQNFQQQRIGKRISLWESDER